MIETWFTSDTHFNHANIIKYCNRPFVNIDEMDAVLIDNWNERVKPNDIVWHLGDFIFSRNWKEIAKLANRLNGKISLLKGNHDKYLYKNRHSLINNKGWGTNSFDTISDSYKEVNINGQRMTLCHYGMRVWNASHWGNWHLYGHSHDTLPSLGRSFDVGVDANDYKPLHFDEVKAKMDKMDFVPVDGHKPEYEQVKEVFKENRKL